MKKLFSLCLLCLLLCACQNKSYQKDAGEIFRTSYHITYQHPRSLQSGIDKALQGINESLSMFNPNSTLSRINQAGVEAVDLSHDALALHLIGEGLKISRLTEGAFDMTVAPLVNLWGFGFSKSQDATQEAIDSILQFVGHEKLCLQGTSVQKQDARLMLDASAIAKGYACDVVADYLESQGIENYLVEIGGEIRLRGHNEKGNIWTVGIDKPIEDPAAVQRELQIAIQLKDKAMATSGNYRNFYLNGNRKVAHTINPATGYPVQHSLLSATVIADNCLTADALATSFMVMGKDKAIALLEKQPDIWAYLIYSDENGHLQTWHSSALEPFLKEL